MEARRRDGRNLDARLPTGTVRRVAHLPVGGRYLPQRRVIQLQSRSSRTRYHEKGHYIWDGRMSARQKAQWARALQQHLEPQAGKRAALRASRRGPAEEIWAEAYAAHKLGRTWRNALGTLVARWLGG